LADKTKTIIKRTVNIYLPTEDMKVDWTRVAAREAGIPEEEWAKRYFLSKFIQRVINDYIARRGDDEYVAPDELVNRIHELEREKAGLSEELRQKAMLVRRLDDDLRACRLKLSGSFTDEGFTGEREYDERLPRLLMKRGYLSHDELLEELGVTPGDAEAVTAITAQLEVLERFKLIKPTPKGWRWMLK